MRTQALLLAVIIAVLIGVLALLFLNVSFFPPLGSQEGEAIDETMRLLLAIGAGIFALIVAILAYSAVRFRRRAGDTADGPPLQSNIVLVAAFFFIPAGLILWSATFGAVKLGQIEGSPTSSPLEVKVTGLQWAWTFEYPEFGVKASELYLPLGRPAVLRMTSRDVVHSFWVPEFRMKMDTLPGVETRLRITPTKAGEYKAMCAELCGLGHTLMVARAKVVTEEEFQAWVKEQKR